MNFTDKYAEQDRRYRERKLTLSIIAPEVAKLLGEGWSVHEKIAVVGDGLPNYVELKGPDGAEVSISAGSSFDKTSGISCHFNDYHEGVKFWYLPWKTTRPSINVNLTRGAKAVAGEIKRRLLPDYLPLLAQCEAARRGHLAQKASTSTVAQDIAKFIGSAASNVTRDGITTEVNVYRSVLLSGVSMDLKVNGDEVTFDRVRVTPDVAKKLLAVLIAAQPRPVAPAYPAPTMTDDDAVDANREEQGGHFPPRHVF